MLKLSAVGRFCKILFVLFCLDTKKDEKKSRQKEASPLMLAHHSAFLSGQRACNATRYVELATKIRLGSNSVTYCLLSYCWSS